MNDSRDLPPVVEFDRVSFSYPGTPILNQVSFQVYPGEFIGMIGPDGGGKTTLLKLILGFLKPTGGTIRIFDEKAGEHAFTPNRLAYVPQSVRFDREFPISVEEVVLSGLLSRLPWYGKFRAADRRAAKEALEYMGLSHLAANSFGDPFRRPGAACADRTRAGLKTPIIASGRTDSKRRRSGRIGHLCDFESAQRENDDPHGDA